MLPIYLKRLFRKLFGFKKNQLIFMCHEFFSYHYQTMTRMNYISFNHALNRILRNDDCYLAIKSQFNNIHYPVIDVDDYNELPRVLSSLQTRYIPYVIIQSSPSHYWVIIDKGKKNFIEANRVLLLLGKVGCKDYYKVSQNEKCFVIRAFYQSRERIPKILSFYQHHTVESSRIMGAWRSFNKQNIQTLSTAYSPNFAQFMNKLKYYYETSNEDGCRYFSSLKHGEV